MSSCFVGKVDVGKFIILGSVAKPVVPSVEGCQGTVGSRVVVVGGSNGKSKEVDKTQKRHRMSMRAKSVRVYKKAKLMDMFYKNSFSFSSSWHYKSLKFLISFELASLHMVLS